MCIILLQANTLVPVFKQPSWENSDLFAPHTVYKRVRCPSLITLEGQVLQRIPSFTSTPISPQQIIEEQFATFDVKSFVAGNLHNHAEK